MTPLAAPMDPFPDDICRSVVRLAAGPEPGPLRRVVDALGLDELRALSVTLATRLATQVGTAASTHPGDGAPGLGSPHRVAVSTADLCAAAVNAAAEAFGTTPEAVRSSARAQEVCDARAAAMCAVRATGLSLLAIAAAFHKDHTSVMHAVRRASARPRLAAVAAGIGEELARLMTDGSRVGPQVGGRGGPRGGDPPGRATPSGVVEPSTLPGRPKAVPVLRLLPDPAPGAAPGSSSFGAALELAARTFDTTPDPVLGRDARRPALEARAVAMSAARLSGMSVAAIAAECGDRDQGAVLRSVRWVDGTPPLREVACLIARDVGVYRGAPPIGRSAPPHPATGSPRGDAPGGGTAAGARGDAGGVPAGGLCDAARGLAQGRLEAVARGVGVGVGVGGGGW